LMCRIFAFYLIFYIFLSGEWSDWISNLPPRARHGSGYFVISFMCVVVQNSFIFTNNSNSFAWYSATCIFFQISSNTLGHLKKKLILRIPNLECASTYLPFEYLTALLLNTIRIVCPHSLELKSTPNQMLGLRLTWHMVV
jgi:hypothetical protein